MPERPPAPYPRFVKPQRVAFVQSSWHRDVVEECRIAFLEEIEARHIARAQVDLFEVPGSFEIPLHAQLLAKTRRYTAIVAAGLVVDGGIYRHEFVADTVIKALMDVQLKTEVPIFSAVLTPQQFHDSAVHHDFFRKHFVIKGIEVAEACANTLHSLERLRGQVAAGIVGRRGAKAHQHRRLRTVPGRRSADCQFPRRVYKLGGGRRARPWRRAAETIMFEGHDPYLVALSVVIAILGGYTGFGLAARIRGTPDASHRLLLAGAAFFSPSASGPCISSACWRRRCRRAPSIWCCRPSYRS